MSILVKMPCPNCGGYGAHLGAKETMWCSSCGDDVTDTGGRIVAAGYIKMPESLQEARAMNLLSEAYIKQHSTEPK